LHSIVPEVAKVVKAVVISIGTPISVRNLPMFSLSTSTAFHLPGMVSLIAICAR